MSCHCSPQHHINYFCIHWKILSCLISFFYTLWRSRMDKFTLFYAIPWVKSGFRDYPCYTDPDFFWDIAFIYIIFFIKGRYRYSTSPAGGAKTSFPIVLCVTTESRGFPATVDPLPRYKKIQKLICLVIEVKITFMIKRSPFLLTVTFALMVAVVFFCLFWAQILDIITQIAFHNESQKCGKTLNNTRTAYIYIPIHIKC